MDFSEFQTNLVPYPLIDRMLSSALIISAEKAHIEKPVVAEITMSASEPASPATEMIWDAVSGAKVSGAKSFFTAGALVGF